MANSSIFFEDVEKRSHMVFSTANLRKKLTRKALQAILRLVECSIGDAVVS